MNLFRQILNLSLIAIAMTAAVGCSSSEEKEVRQLYGQVVHTEGDSMLVVVSGTDTLSVRRTNIAAEMPFVQDSVVIYYVMNNNGQMHIEDLIVLNHNQPVLNNITAMLIGTWDIEDEDCDLRQILFDNSLKAKAIEKDGKGFDIQWLIKGKNVIYGSGISSITDNDSFQIVSVDAQHLTVATAVAEYRLRRLYN